MCDVDESALGIGAITIDRVERNNGTWMWTKRQPTCYCGPGRIE